MIKEIIIITIIIIIIIMIIIIIVINLYSILIKKTYRKYSASLKKN